MKRILVPCDFSLQARAAYKTAMHWAKQTGGEVVLLHVGFVPVYSSLGGEMMTYGSEYLEALETQGQAEFVKMKQEINLPSVVSKLVFQYGDVVFAIKNFIDVNKMDMIIMGTSGSSGAAEIFIGSNTEKVVRHSPVPVLAVRDFVAVSSVKKILLPTLLGLDQTEFIMKVAELQKFLNAELHLLRVNNPAHFVSDSDANEAFEDLKKQYRLEHCEFHFKNYRNEEEGIIDFASTEKMDLIAMATHARKGLAHIFNGSITEDVVNHITSPVWTFKLRK